jgi:hypothetical protein
LPFNFLLLTCFMFIISQFRVCYVTLFFTLILIIAVSLRNANNRIFYELCTYRVQVNQLKQELGVKQLRFESITNPAAIQQRLGELNKDG